MKFMVHDSKMGIPGGAVVKNPLADAGNAGERGSIPWVRKIPWRRQWQPTPVLLPGKSHGRRSLAGYTLWGRKRAGHDWVTERAHTHLKGHPAPAQLLYHHQWDIPGSIRSQAVPRLQKPSRVLRPHSHLLSSTISIKVPKDFQTCGPPPQQTLWTPANLSPAVLTPAKVNAAVVNISAQALCV